jgi:hypothetical protein
MWITAMNSDRLKESEVMMRDKSWLKHRADLI